MEFLWTLFSISVCVYMSTCVCICKCVCVCVCLDHFRDGGPWSTPNEHRAEAAAVPWTQLIITLINTSRYSWMIARLISVPGLDTKPEVNGEVEAVVEARF